jgi:deoxyadenosine/deoxycytidine kinase
MIVISGMVGLGKTTAAQILSKELSIPAYFESVKGNKILPLFYTATPEETEKQRYPFLLQLSFLYSRSKQLQSALKAPNAVLDRSIYEDRYFAQVIHDEGRLSDLELAVYDGLFREMIEEIPGTPQKAPDVLIYLYASFETALKRLTTRGRAYEMTPESLKHLHLIWEGYDHWLASSYRYGPVIKVDVDERDLALNPKDRSWLLEQVRPYLAKPHPYIQ